MLGLAFLVGGIILLVFGINKSDSVSDEISNLFSGSPTSETVWFIVGGAAAAVLGLGMLLFGRGGGKKG
jgi:hypothetical protein